MNVTDADRLQLVKHIVDSYLQGEIGPLFAALADDVTVRLTIAGGTPLSGVFEGHAGLGEYFTRNAQIVETHSMEVLNYLAGGNQVAVTGRETLTVRKTGQLLNDQDWVMLYSFREDRIASILIIEDTSPLSAAYQGEATPTA